jgi:hypothetical protein
MKEALQARALVFEKFSGKHSFLPGLCFDR